MRIISDYLGQVRMVRKWDLSTADIVHWDGKGLFKPEYEFD